MFHTHLSPLGPLNVILSVLLVLEGHKSHVEIKVLLEKRARIQLLLLSLTLFFIRTPTVFPVLPSSFPFSFWAILLLQWRTGMPFPSSVPEKTYDV